MILTPKKIVSITFTVIILLLALPASAILASWNSLPGDILYPVKRGLEKTALAITPNSLLEAKLHFAFLDRRAKEAGIALIQEPNDQQVLDDILTEAIAAQITTTTLKPEQQTIATIELIQKLNQTSEQLDQVKKTITYSPPTTQPELETSVFTQPTTAEAPVQNETAPPSTTKTNPDPVPPSTNTTTEPKKIIQNSSSTPITIPAKDPILPKTITPTTTQQSTSSITQTQEQLNQIVAKAEEKLKNQNLNQEHKEKLKKIKREHLEKVEEIKEDNHKNKEKEKSSKKKRNQDDD